MGMTEGGQEFTMAPACGEPDLSCSHFLAMCLGKGERRLRRNRVDSE